MTSYHLPDIPYLCGLCGYYFQTLYDLDLHVNNCPLDTPQLPQLNITPEVHEFLSSCNREMYTCYKCNEHFAVFDDLAVHTEAYHPAVPAHSSIIPMAISHRQLSSWCYSQLSMGDLSKCDHPFSMFCKMPMYRATNHIAICQTNS